MSIRLHPGSALDVLADSPQAHAWGFTRRVHDVVTRYAQVIRDSHHRLPQADVARMAQRLRTLNAELPVYNAPDLTAALAMLWRADTTTGHFPNMTFPQLLSLVEEIEEIAARAAYDTRGTTQ